MKLDGNFSGDMSISPDQSIFSDGGRHGVFYLFVIRVFYICGPPAYEEIGKLSNNRIYHMPRSVEVL
jgi:hypothetical protein